MAEQPTPEMMAQMDPHDLDPADVATIEEVTA